MSINNALAHLAIYEASGAAAIRGEHLRAAVERFNAIVQTAMHAEGMTDYCNDAVEVSTSALRGKVLPIVADMVGSTIEKSGRSKVVVLDREAFEAEKTESGAGSVQIARDALSAVFDSTEGAESLAGKPFNRRGLVVVTADDICSALPDMERYNDRQRATSEYAALRTSLKLLAIECAEQCNDAFEPTGSLEGKGVKSFAVYVDFFV